MLTGQPSCGEDNKYEKNNDLDLIDMKTNEVAKKNKCFSRPGVYILFFTARCKISRKCTNGCYKFKVIFYEFTF